MKKKGRLGPGTEEIETAEPSRLERERCMNPWNGKCGNLDIALYIMHKGKRLPICRRCWRIISSSKIEWVYD